MKFNQRGRNENCRVFRRSGHIGHGVAEEKYDAEIITYTGDLGQGDDLPAIKEKALSTGAVAAVVDDLRERFVTQFIWAAARRCLVRRYVSIAYGAWAPFVGWRLCEVADEYGADAIITVALGNDQVRFEVAAQCLAPI